MLLALTAATATAHHGTTKFDGNTVVTLEGTVIENRWTNPHATLLLETRNADGSTRTIEAIMASVLPQVTVMFRSGSIDIPMNRSSFFARARISVAALTAVFF